MKIILGSSSAGRHMVMRELGHDFETMSPDIDEKAIRRDSPDELVMAIAQAKADALLPKIKGSAILVTSDQVVLYKGKIREKPVDKKEAKEFLESYAHAPAQTVGAIVVVNTETGKRVQGLQTAHVHFKPFSADFISSYLGESDEALRGAGGFVIQNPIFKPYVARIEGTFDSAAGLSKDLVTRLIAEATS